MSVKVAFAGVGESARPYLDELARRPEVALVGVCDANRRAAEQVAAGWGARVFARADLLLEEACPDVLWICTLAASQGELAALAAQRRIPFFLEPPGAADYGTIKKLGRLVRESGLVSAVGFPVASVDVAREAREYLGANVVPLALGWWQRPAREASRAAATALLWDEACHLVHALRYFCGDIAEVRSFPAGSEAVPELAGGLVAHLRFARGTSAVLTLATFPRPEPRVELELAGEGWSLTFGEGLHSLRVAERDKTTILRRLNDPVAEQVKGFLDAVAAGDPALVPVSFADAAATLAACEAARLSAREGCPVELATLEAEPD